MDGETQPSLADTPGGSRVRIAFFGLRNAGKSTLVNGFCGQEVAIVSDVPGTTTDPVSKAMEILPLGPCTVIDTAGLDDEGPLGAERVRRTMETLAGADIAVWVEAERDDSTLRENFLSECARRNVAALVHRRGDTPENLRARIASIAVRQEPGLLDGLASAGDLVVCVCPIDESAPKGRLILPQVQTVRDCLDRGAVCTACTPQTLPGVLAEANAAGRKRALVVTDSQAFAEVGRAVDAARAAGLDASLTSFSILFARQKGDLDEYRKGLAAIASLEDGDTVVVAEGCTHHRQCNDIGSVKIPKALERLAGRKLTFRFASGRTFDPEGAALAVHCGGCMLTRRQMLHRIGQCREKGVPIVNYGLLLASAAERKDLADGRQA